MADRNDPQHRKADRKAFASDLHQRTIDSKPQESLLEAWLDQSAIPAQGESDLERSRLEQESSDLEARDLETQEIKVFRNVHIPTAAVGPYIRSFSLGHVSECSLTYYLDIIEMYPLVPQYLARRLTEATWRRAQRLRRSLRPLPAAAHSSLQNTMAAHVSKASRGRPVRSTLVSSTERPAVRANGQDLSADDGDMSGANRRSKRRGLKSHRTSASCSKWPWTALTVISAREHTDTMYCRVLLETEDTMPPST